MFFAFLTAQKGMNNRFSMDFNHNEEDFQPIDLFNDDNENFQ